MTWSYTDNFDSTTDEGRKNRVRLMIGDTDTSDQQLSDEAIIDFYLDGANDDPALAAIAACRGLVAKYSRQADTRHGKMAISASKRADNYRSLLADLQAESNILAEPYAGGMTESEKDSLANDTDAIQPSFEIGRDDNEGYSDETRWGDR